MNDLMMNDPMNSMNMPISHLLIGSLLRATELIPLTLLMGWQVFLVLIMRSDMMASQGTEGRAAVVRYDQRLTVGALAVILMAMVVGFGHESMMMSRRSFTALGPWLWPILTKTHFGHVMIARAVLWGGFALAWLRQSRRSESSDLPDSIVRGRGLLLVLGALWCLTRSLSGHSADQGDWSMDVLVDWLHLVAVSFWVGGVVPLALLVPVLMRHAEPAAARLLLIRLLERFSPVAMSCVAVLIAAGLYTAHRRGVTLLAPFESDYGDLVAFKVVLTVVAVWLGGFSKFFVLPALRRELKTGETWGNGRFRRAIRVEAGVLLFIIVAAAVLTQTPPAGNVSLTSGPMTHPPMKHRPVTPSPPAPPASKAPPPSLHHDTKGNGGNQEEQSHSMPGMPGM
jgi:putative copper resistance protein D